jgi:hypothetical protein
VGHPISWQLVTKSLRQGAETSDVRLLAEATGFQSRAKPRYLESFFWIAVAKDA